MSLRRKLKSYYVTAVTGVVFAFVGFSYNAWRLEVTEDNDNVRTASFQVLKELAQFELAIYAAHYDQDPVEGNPRKGWVRVGLITDLSALIDPAVEEEAERLKQDWGDGWRKLPEDRATADGLVSSIDRVRMEIKAALRGLR